MLKSDRIRQSSPILLALLAGCALYGLWTLVAGTQPLLLLALFNGLFLLLGWLILNSRKPTPPGAPVAVECEITKVMQDRLQRYLAPEGGEDADG